eukprot:g3797.t1
MTSKRVADQVSQPPLKKQALAPKKTPSVGNGFGGFGPSSGKREEMAKQKLLSMFDNVLEDLLEYSKPHIPASGLTRLREMCQYNILGGKMYRGMMVVNTVALQCNSSDKEKMQQAMIVAWCVEILQAAFLVADDVMDRSITRRGKDCWYRKTEREGMAINDALLLESFVYILLKKHFRTTHQSLYLELTDLFREVTHRTELGQMLDIACETSPDISLFTVDNYKKICYNKTALYTFYLPVMAGLQIACDGNVPSTTSALCDQICRQLGLKFQIQDDYLDCFGDSQVMGKVGTDIRDHKCTWLLLQALGLASPAQLQSLKEWYGKDEEEAKVKNLYRTLGLPKLYQKQEEKSLREIRKLIKDASDAIKEAVFLPVLDKMHGRPK